MLVFTFTLNRDIILVFFTAGVLGYDGPESPNHTPSHVANIVFAPSAKTPHSLFTLFKLRVVSFNVTNPGLCFPKVNMTLRNEVFCYGTATSESLLLPGCVHAVCTLNTAATFSFPGCTVSH